MILRDKENKEVIVNDILSLSENGTDACKVISDKKIQMYEKYQLTEKKRPISYLKGRDFRIVPFRPDHWKSTAEQREEYKWFMDRQRAVANKEFIKI